MPMPCHAMQCNLQIHISFVHSFFLSTFVYSVLQNLRTEISSLEKELEETITQLEETTSRLAAVNEAPEKATTMSTVTAAGTDDKLIEELNVLMEAKLDAEARIETAHEEIEKLKQDLRMKERNASEQQVKSNTTK